MFHSFSSTMFRAAALGAQLNRLPICSSSPFVPSFSSSSSLGPIRQFHASHPLPSDGYLAWRLRNWPRDYKNQPRDRKPIKDYNMIKGIVLRTLVKRPRKPNSGNRQCVYVKLVNGQECFAYIPGEGHNLQEHSTVMVRGGRRKDIIGIKANVVRGMLDCAPVKKKTTTAKPAAGGS